MRVLCAIGRRGGPELVRRALAVTGAGSELVLVHVVDTGPRDDLRHFAGPWRRGPLADPERGRDLEAAEEAAARDVLTEAEAEAQRGGASVTTRSERGRPEQVIVALAREVGADLVVIRARENPEGHPTQGPPSVGHTARFVVDHAPCDVLLVRAVPGPGHQLV